MLNPNDDSNSVSLRSKGRPTSAMRQDAPGDKGDKHAQLVKPAKDAFFCEENSSTQEDELVRFGIDMTKLSDYLDNIIRVVNQHAKLLDDVS